MTRYFVRDKKLQRWELIEPHGDEKRWMALSYRYDPNAPVVVYAPTREAAIAELEKFSVSHEFHFNKDDANRLAAYGALSVLVGGATAGVASMLGYPLVSKAAGYKALFGVGAIAAGVALEAKIRRAPRAT